MARTEPESVKRVTYTEEELLARVPRKDFLTTEEVQHALGDVHQVTVYKWIQQGLLKGYRMRSRGRANVYKREGPQGVLALIRSRFVPVPIDENGGNKDGGPRTEGVGGDDESSPAPRTRRTPKK